MENIEKTKFKKRSKGHKQRFFYAANRSNYRTEDDYRYKKYSPTQERGRFSKNKYGKKKFKKKPSRPASPIVGSEEYMSQKIKKTSAIIMRHLLSPEENIIPINNSIGFIPLENQQPHITETSESRTESKRTKSISELTNKKPSFNVDEIHNKIMNHLSNLNNGRKKNFISTSTSVYDETIQQILKQKRLEISRALRNVCMQTSNINESTEWINSIIPDMGIKIEDLPQEILEALEITFSKEDACLISEDVPVAEFPLEDSNDNTVSIKEELMEICEILPCDIQYSNSPKQEHEVIEAQCIEPSQETPILTPAIKNCKNKDVALDDETLSQTPAVQSYIDVDLACDQEIPVQTPIVKNFIDVSHQVSQNYPPKDNESQNETLKDSHCASTQTKKITIEDLLQRNFRKPPKTFSMAMKRMLQIDQYIAKLTEYRQNMFKGLKIKKKQNAHQKNSSNTKKIKETVSASDNNCENVANSDSESIRNEEVLLEFGDITEKMLVLKICEDKLLAGTESGKIYFFNLNDGHCSRILEVTNVPISCLHYSKEEQGKPYLFVGYFGSSLKVYNFYSICLIQEIEIDHSVQCMDANWGYIFMGCMSGTISRYSIKKNSLEYQERFDFNPIFVIRAAQEGARMVLLIGSRNSSVIIRDAISGLHLRTLENIISPTVYSMILERHFVYCGTTTHDILIFDFHNGKLKHKYKATNAKGIGCMKVVGKCLFASCHNGKVYVYNVENNAHIGTLDGPGGVIISMEVLTNQVVVGTMSCKFSSIKIPKHILSQV